MKIWLPPVVGGFVVFALLMIVALARDGHYTFVYSEGDKHFYRVFVPLALVIAWIAQWAFVLPVWNKSQMARKVLGLTLYQLAALVCLVGGITLGFIFWEPGFGSSNLVAGILWSIGAFVVYGITNLLVLWLLQRKTTPVQQLHP